MIGNQIIHVFETPARPLDPKQYWLTVGEYEVAGEPQFGIKGATRRLSSAACTMQHRDEDLFQGLYTPSHFMEDEDYEDYSIYKTYFIHAKCRTYVRQNRIDVRLLRVCRQIYAEANGFQYSTNTFLIDQPHPFALFAKSFLVTKEAILRTEKSQNASNYTLFSKAKGPLNIQCLHFTAYPKHWKYRATSRLSDVNLSGKIRQLYLSISLTYSPPKYYARCDHDYVYFGVESLKHHGPWMKYLLPKIRGLQAKNLTVLARETLPEDWAEREEAWPVERDKEEGEEVALTGEDEPTWHSKVTTWEMRAEMANIVKLLVEGTKEEVQDARDKARYKNAF